MNRLPFVLDSVLGKLTGFAIGFVIGAYFTGGAALILFAAVFGICTSELWLYALRAKDGKRPRPVDEALRNSLIYADDRYALEVFYKALSARHKVTRERKFIGVDGTALYCRIKPAPLEADRLVDMLTYALRRGFRSAVVLTDSYSPAAEKAARNFPDMKCRLLGFDGVQRLLTAVGACPKKASSRKKRNMGSVFRGLLSPRHAGGYILFGASLLLVSRFSILPVYYLAAGCVAIALGLAARIFGRKTE